MSRTVQRTPIHVTCLLIVSASSCSCESTSSIRDPAELSGTYALRRVNDVDSSNWLIVNSDGGYCHGFPSDGGETIECGAWRASVDERESSIALDGFRESQFSQTPSGRGYAYTTEKKGRARRIVIDWDNAIYFMATDGGSVVAP